VKRIIVIIAGWFFIVTGFLGLFLPILQGVLFLCIGVYILSYEYAWAKNIIDKIRAKSPKMHETVDKAKQKAREIFNKIFK
jgi:uncharacterized membrane protein YbaN (DUF454 family)